MEVIMKFGLKLTC